MHYWSLFLAGVFSAALAQPPSPTPPADLPPVPAVPKVAGLELPLPQQVAAGDQFIEIEAQCAGEVAWDVFALLADPKAVLRTKKLGKVLILGIPACAGDVRITACTVIEGKPSEIASTLVHIEPLPLAEVKQEARSELPQGNLAITLLGMTPEIVSALRPQLTIAGHRVYVLADTQTRVDLVPYLANVKLPAVLVQDSKGNVLLGGGKSCATAAEALAVVKQAQGK